MLLPDSQIRRGVSLAAATLAIGLIWLVVLPFIGEQPAVVRHITAQQQLKIDPSAMFYTELETASVLTNHVERLSETYPEKFWK